jgi:hypothetical protein
MRLQIFDFEKLGHVPSPGQSLLCKQSRDHLPFWRGSTLGIIKYFPGESNAKVVHGRSVLPHIDDHIVAAPQISEIAAFSPILRRGGTVPHCGNKAAARSQSR